LLQPLAVFDVALAARNIFDVTSIDQANLKTLAF